jgi:serine/threonine protein kinase
VAVWLTVYLATDLRLERRVAIKVMHGHLADDSQYKARFIQEAALGVTQRPQCRQCLRPGA